MSESSSKKRGPGRPKADDTHFPRIDTTPEQLMRILTGTPPKDADDWRYLREHEARKP